MGFHDIEDIDETGKLNAPISGVFKGNLAVPHIHRGVRMTRSTLPLVCGRLMRANF